MSDQLRIWIKLDALADRHGLNDAAAAALWLVEHGFEKELDSWVAEYSDIALLADNEIARLESLDGSETGPRTDERDMAAQSPLRSLPQAYQSPPKSHPILKHLPRYEECSVPSILVGTPREVVPKIRKLARRVAKLKSFRAGFAGIPMVPISDIRGMLIIRRGNPEKGSKGI